MKSLKAREYELEARVVVDVAERFLEEAIASEDEGLIEIARRKVENAHIESEKLMWSASQIEIVDNMFSGLRDIATTYYEEDEDDDDDEREISQCLFSKIFG